ncbi:MAG: phosphoribosyltransferase family protein [Azoarcus sp.]|nr:phosphoribosyltransferase family protein [Azoarcus sp.]
MSAAPADAASASAPAPAPLAPLRQHLIAFPNGRLQLTIEACHGEAEDLIGFAARANPRRAFLFLSKILGKHYPAHPAAMAAMHRWLADGISASDGPIVFIGMAETATGLGQGVYEAWRDAHPAEKTLYLQTTRYRIDAAACLSFEESHSHAPNIFLHLPRDAAHQACFAAARRVVLIDDELSTGNTFVNLLQALREVMPRLAAVHLATICDFMGETRRRELRARMHLPCSVTAAIRGDWRWQAADGDALALAASAAAQCNYGHEVRLTDNGYGRLGRARRFDLPAALERRLAAERTEGPTLVLGCGEFMHASFVLARALAAHGVDTAVQATTRSPILIWGDVRHALTVPDPYGEGVPNYLYNVRPGQYGRVLICHETAANPALYELARLVGGRLIQFLPGDYAEEIPVR